ncbi:MAG: Hsp20/alpha crystallin family protein [Desulfobacterales bacterium]|nr:MAG: Hsp20/alpha crystallin family protein [Desulfobacterales bacterium]
MIIKRMLDFPNYGWRSAFDELERMRQDMDRLFGQVAGRAYWPTHAGVFPLVNVTEDKDHFYIRGEIPGMKSQEINISATGRNLTISGERKIASEGGNVRYHRREREDGKFSRVIALPSDIQVGKIEANYVDGILSIKIPKAEEAKPKQIIIK